MTRVKLCGLTAASDVDAAVAAGADAIGFVVDVGVDTHREVSVDEAAALVETAPPFVTTVAVTMADSHRRLEDIVERTRCDAVQLHVGDDPDAVRAVAGGLPRPVIVAIEPALPTAEALDDAADALLVDSVDAAGGGGTGRVHDWAQTRTIVDRVASPVILAGGLTPANVAEAVRAVRPYAVDVSTGVEGPDGRKDAAAMGRFVHRADALTAVRP